MAARFDRQHLIMPTTQQRIAAAIRPAIDEGVLPGAVALVERNGEELFFDAIGWTDVERTRPMARDTIFRIASMTKPITTAAALLLVDDGVIGLDDPIARWLPELAGMRVLARPDGSLADTVPAQRAISVRDLMTHRAGFTYAINCTGELSEALRGIGGDVLPELEPDAWLAQLGQLPLMYQPGTRWNYGYSTDVLGVLIQRAAGMAFAEFLQRRLFTPLGMRDTGFHVPSDKLQRLAPAYVRNRRSNTLQLHDPVDGRWSRPPVFDSGGAGLVSTVDDYMAFARQFAGTGTQPLLSARSLALMSTDVLTPEEHALPFMGMPGFWRSIGFGLGLSVVTDPAQHAAATNAGRCGWPGAFGTFWFADPKEQTVGILMIQDYWSGIPIAIDFQNAIAAG